MGPARLSRASPHADAQDGFEPPEWSREGVFGSLPWADIFFSLIMYPSGIEGALSTAKAPSLLWRGRAHTEPAASLAPGCSALSGGGHLSHLACPERR